MLTVEDIFPPFALRISCGPLELRVLRDDDLPELVEVVRGGIQVPGLPMPFLLDSHDLPFAPGSPDGFPTSSLAWWWTQRATFAADEWRLALVVRRHGVLVGMQDLHAKDFAQTRRVMTGSWLGQAHHGMGVGTLMRQLVVGFAFDELAAEQCESGYIVGNHASAAVSRKVGYVDNGGRRIVQHTRHGKVGLDEQRVIVTPATFTWPDDRISVEGAEVLRRFLRIDREPADPVATVLAPGRGLHRPVIDP